MKVHGFAVLVILCMGVAAGLDYALKDKVSMSSNGFKLQNLGNLFTKKNDGFLDIADGAIPKNSPVMVYVPRKPKAESRQRADTLIAYLKENSIPYQEIQKIQINYPATMSKFDIQRVEVVTMGEVPVVIVNNRIKANPLPEEVLRQYKNKP